MKVQTLKWVGGVNGFLELLDQRRLPTKVARIRCRDIETVCDAIRTLAVRGAPAIGVAAAYGLVLGVQKLPADSSLQQGLFCLAQSSEKLSCTRPTAVNLFWALDRVRQSAKEFVISQPDADLQSLQKAVLAEANAIYRQDVQICQKIGENGQKFIREGAGILTHCNAGALATAGQGTALSVMFEAHKRGRKFRVYVDETRPLLQGARLTAWELKQADIDVTLICDNMAGWLMKQGQISAVITGADRITANGDAANKIGTYSLSILAKAHNVPFYIAAPSSSFDLSIKNAAEIPIEQRPPEEVTRFAKTEIAPAGIAVYNPAFDVTDASHITAIITERGIIENPDKDNILQCLRG
jgi:methylthioribose-1-phosphate isomerase